jgi:hypothetical protein
MTSDRSRAYARVMKTLSDMDRKKLHADELASLREAADTLLFTTDPSEARRALRDATDLTDRLVEYGRWTPQTAQFFMRDLWSCGHLSIVIRAAA